jgi:hypothetical protein
MDQASGKFWSLPQIPQALTFSKITQAEILFQIYDSALGNDVRDLIRDSVQKVEISLDSPRICDILRFVLLLTKVEEIEFTFCQNRSPWIRKRVDDIHKINPAWTSRGPGEDHCYTDWILENSIRLSILEMAKLPHLRDIRFDNIGKVDTSFDMFFWLNYVSGILNVPSQDNIVAIPRKRDLTHFNYESRNIRFIKGKILFEFGHDHETEPNDGIDLSSNLQLFLLDLVTEVKGITVSHLTGIVHGIESRNLYSKIDTLFINYYDCEELDQFFAEKLIKVLTYFFRRSPIRVLNGGQFVLTYRFLPAILKCLNMDYIPNTIQKVKVLTAFEHLPLLVKTFSSAQHFWLRIYSELDEARLIVVVSQVLAGNPQVTQVRISLSEGEYFENEDQPFEGDWGKFVDEHLLILLSRFPAKFHSRIKLDYT